MGDYSTHKRKITSSMEMFDSCTNKIQALASLRPVKPCPGVPDIHLNAEYIVSMTAALLCGAGRHLCTNFRGCSADPDHG